MMKELNLVLYLERIYAEIGCALHCIRRESKDLPIGDGSQLAEIHAMIVQGTQELSVAQSKLRSFIEDRIAANDYFGRR